MVKRRCFPRCTAKAPSLGIENFISGAKKVLNPQISPKMPLFIARNLNVTPGAPGASLSTRCSVVLDYGCVSGGWQLSTSFLLCKTHGRSKQRDCRHKYMQTLSRDSHCKYFFSHFYQQLEASPR